MEEGEIAAVFEKVESAIKEGRFGSVGELGFWKAVTLVKSDKALAERFGGAVGRIDKALFESKTGAKLSYTTGTLIMLAAAVFGLALLYLGSVTEGASSTAYFLASALILMTALHPISHIIAARRFGIRFHFYFLNGPMRVEPTLKIDYETYVKAPSNGRALFHLAGAVNSVAVVLLVLLVALATPDTPTLAKTLLSALFIFTTASEILPIFFIKLGIPKILFSDFRKSDTHRFLRELKG
jgi:hypothetical protein